jgi:hypothetical protein
MGNKFFFFRSAVDTESRSTTVRHKLLLFNLIGVLIHMHDAILLLRRPLINLFWPPQFLGSEGTGLIVVRIGNPFETNTVTVPNKRKKGKGERK